MKNIYAIDPGSEKSAIVHIGPNGITGAIKDNYAMLMHLEMLTCGHLSIEMIASYGMPVGKEIFETCVWIGRFIQAWEGGYTKIYRKDVKMHLCGSTKAKDSNIRQALIDRYGPGRDKAIGLRKAQGPLYGFSKDMWAALAVAVTYMDMDPLSETYNIQGVI